MHVKHWLLTLFKHEYTFFLNENNATIFIIGYIFIKCNTYR